MNWRPHLIGAAFCSRANCQAFDRRQATNEGRLPQLSLFAHSLFAVCQLQLSDIYLLKDKVDQLADSGEMTFTFQR